MRILGLDLGTKTLGVAITDRSNTLASKLCTIRYNKYEDLIKELRIIIEEKEITKLVLGLPKNMDNSMGFASQRSLDFKEILISEFGLEVILVDERLSTVEAERYLIDLDMRRSKRKQVIDGVAACIILETYLGGINNGIQ